MPIYEYESLDPSKACEKCLSRFEIIQGSNEAPVSECPNCGGDVRRVMSWCRAAIVESRDEYARVKKKISEYEKQGMWSHAAELADKHSEKIKDRDTKMRALENYKKAGYNVDSLEKGLKEGNS